MFESALFAAFVLGVRRAELVALRVSDIDSSSGCVHIRRTIVCRGKMVIEKDRPKSPRGMRDIELDEGLVSWITAHILARRDYLKHLGIPFSGDTALFDRGDGQAWHPDAFCSGYRLLLRRSGIPHVKLNGTRHTFASIAYEIGAQDSVIQDAMGHESRRTTQEWYITTTEAARRAVHGSVASRLIEEIAKIEESSRP